VRAKLGQLPFAVIGKALVRRLGDREAEDAVAEKLEPLVRAAALLGPRRMRERLLAKLGWELRQQLLEAGTGRRVVPRSWFGCASRLLRCSRRPDRRSGCLGRLRPRS
jgi:hypothetical protein